jgi:hypothetical protein
LDEPASDNPLDQREVDGPLDEPATDNPLDQREVDSLALDEPATDNPLDQREVDSLALNEPATDNLLDQREVDSLALDEPATDNLLDQREVDSRALDQPATDNPLDQPATDNHLDTSVPLNEYGKEDEELILFTTDLVPNGCKCNTTASSKCIFKHISVAQARKTLMRKCINFNDRCKNYISILCDGEYCSTCVFNKFNSNKSEDVVDLDDVSLSSSDDHNFIDYDEPITMTEEALELKDRQQLSGNIAYHKH